MTWYHAALHFCPFQEAIESVDSDGSGFVDIEEFLELMRMKTKESSDEAEIKEAFRILDRDNKGTVKLN